LKNKKSFFNYGSAPDREFAVAVARVWELKRVVCIDGNVVVVVAFRRELKMFIVEATFDD